MIGWWVRRRVTWRTRGSIQVWIRIWSQTLSIHKYSALESPVSRCSLFHPSISHYRELSAATHSAMAVSFLSSVPSFLPLLPPQTAISPATAHPFHTVSLCFRCWCEPHSYSNWCLIADSVVWNFRREFVVVRSKRMLLLATRIGLVEEMFFKVSVVRLPWWELFFFFFSFLNFYILFSVPREMCLASELIRLVHCNWLLLRTHNVRTEWTIKHLYMSLNELEWSDYEFLPVSTSS